MTNMVYKIEVLTPFSWFNDEFFPHHKQTEKVSRDAYAAYPSTTEMVIGLAEENNSLRNRWLI